jgi:hypothetical protein
VTVILRCGYRYRYFRYFRYHRGLEINDHDAALGQEIGCLHAVAVSSFVEMTEDSIPE